MNRTDEALDVLSRIYSFNTGNSKKVKKMILEYFVVQMTNISI